MVEESGERVCNDGIISQTEHVAQKLRLGMLFD